MGHRRAHGNKYNGVAIQRGPAQGAKPRRRIGTSGLTRDDFGPGGRPRRPPEAQDRHSGPQKRHFSAVGAAQSGKPRRRIGGLGHWASRGPQRRPTSSSTCRGPSTPTSHAPLVASGGRRTTPSADKTYGCGKSRAESWLGASHVHSRRRASPAWHGPTASTPSRESLGRSSPCGPLSRSRSSASRAWHPPRAQAGVSR